MHGPTWRRAAGARRFRRRGIPDTPGKRHTATGRVSSVPVAFPIGFVIGIADDPQVRLCQQKRGGKTDAPYIDIQPKEVRVRLVRPLDDRPEAEYQCPGQCPAIPREVVGGPRLLPSTNRFARNLAGPRAVSAAPGRRNLACQK